MNNNQIILITGTSKGIGRYLVDYYCNEDYMVYGCSRQEFDKKHPNYEHFCLDVSDEQKVKMMLNSIKKKWGKLDILINNAGIASMNHIFLTPLSTFQRVFETNVFGTFLFCREAAKLMRKNNCGRIINFATVATPLKLEGEAAYASSKAAIESLTEILSRELAGFGITVNAIGPTPILTDLIKSVPKEKIESLINKQAIKRFGKFSDVSNVINFFIKKESDFITGQILYLGGI